jgi:UDP-glucose-4-epimerase GalE
LKERVLVTGGAGYIGSHVAKTLSQRGYEPIVIDNLVRGHREFVKWGPLIVGCAGDRKLLKQAFDQYRPFGIIHCAGYIDVFESIQKPDLYYENNVEVTRNLLEEMACSQIKNLIFSSTCATYGISSEPFLAENHPQNPTHPYGESKRLAELLIKKHPLNYGILRYFNAAGADPEGELGEKRGFLETHLIPLVLQAAEKQKRFSIYGTDFPTPDGTAIRDYIHATDLAKGHVDALERLEKGSFCLNLGSGIGTSVREIIKTAEKVIGIRIPVTETARREGDPPILVSHIEKARTLIDWSPRFNLEQIIQSAWNWQKLSCFSSSDSIT